MKDFKVWIIESPSKSEWWVMVSSLPNDERPARVLSRYKSQDEAEIKVRSLWVSLND